MLAGLILVLVTEHQGVVLAGRQKVTKGLGGGRLVLEALEGLLGHLQKTWAPLMLPLDLTFERQPPLNQWAGIIWALPFNIHMGLVQHSCLPG